MRIEEGLDFIEGHFEPPIYPRRIATFTTEDIYKSIVATKHLQGSKNVI